MKKSALMLSETQARLLQEMLQIPQLTVPFPKAREAGDLYDAIGTIISEFEAEKAASDQVQGSQSSEAMMES